MQYEKKDPYDIRRHHNALDLNFTYIGEDKYRLPAHWGDEDIIVDLSKCGQEQFQILQCVIVQLIRLCQSFEHIIRLSTKS